MGGHGVLHLLASHPYPSLSHTQQAHSHFLKSGLVLHPHPATKLLTLYASHGLPSLAFLLLDSLPSPDPFAFSSLASVLSSPLAVLSLLPRALAARLPPDPFLLPATLRAAAALPSLLLARALHALALSSTLATDAFVHSSLVHAYLRCGSPADARRVFDTMPQPNVVSWSAMLSGCARLGRVDETLELFETMRDCSVQPNVVSWNGIIAGFNYSGHVYEAVAMLQRMHSEGFVPDGTSISSTLAAASDMEDASIGMQIHAYAFKRGLISDQCVASGLVDMYGKCRKTGEMVRAFDEMGDMDVGSCNALVTGLSRNGLVDDALEAFRKYESLGIELTVVSWTSIVACCAQNGKDMEALSFFREMQLVGIEPNAVTIPCMLLACANIVALMHGKSAHCFSLKKSIFEDVYVGSALVDMYAKCGRIKDARTIFDLIPSRNVVSWNAMVGGYAMHGMAKEALELFHLMKRSRQKPDFVTFTCVLSACSQAGLTDEGRKYFKQMDEEHGIAARMEHYACMISLFGRAGRLEEAYDLIKEIKSEPDACIWGALLSSCRVHGNVSLGEIAAEKLFKLEPSNAGNYVLLSNIYASKGMLNGVDRMRDMMKRMGLRKEPGCSWIEIKNKVHMLLAGDKSHPQMGQIAERLEHIRVEMKRLGYLPSIDFVLQDVEEQEKEHILCGHSEKLAVALGLISTCPGIPLRVIKNLRICGDCHSAIKFISMFEGREIFVRDTNRFHHFKNGVCSCGDYW